MIGQPSSPGICVSELRFGAVKPVAGEATFCIDMAVAPGLDEWQSIACCPPTAKASGSCAAKLRRYRRRVEMAALLLARADAVIEQIINLRAFVTPTDQRLR